MQPCLLINTSLCNKIQLSTLVHNPLQVFVCGKICYFLYDEFTCKLGEKRLALSLLLSASLYLCTFIIILVVHIGGWI